MRILVRNSDEINEQYGYMEDVIVFDNISYVRKVDNSIMFIDNDGEDHYIFSKVSEDRRPVLVDRALSNLVNDGYEIFTNPIEWSYLDELAFPEEESIDDFEDSMAVFNQLKEEQENDNQEI